MSTNRDTFINFLDSYILGKASEEHDVCQLIITKNSTNILFRSILNRFFKVDIEYKHSIIDGYEGIIIINNLGNLRKTVAVMDNDINFKLEYNSSGDTPRVLVVSDSKRKFSFSLGTNSNLESKEKRILNMPQPQMRTELSSELISNISKLYGIFKPENIAVMSLEDSNRNIIKFQSNDSTGNVELSLDNEFVDLFKSKRKNKDDHKFNASYFLKIIETGKSIFDNVDLQNIIAYENNDVPVSCLLFEFEDDNVSAKYILFPQIDII